MAETPEIRKEGCGLVGAILQRGVLKPRKTSESPIPRDSSKRTPVKFLRFYASKRQRGSSDENDMAAAMDSSIVAKPPLKLAEKAPRKPSMDSTMFSTAQGHRTGHSSKSSMSFVNNSSMISTSQVVNSEYTRMLRREPTFTSSEFSVTSHRKSNVSSKGHLYRASTGSVMLVGHLGNLKQKGHNKSLSDSANSRTVQKGNLSGKFAPATAAMGNILKKPTERNHTSGSLNKLDPEALKCLGNEKYQEGKFEEALDLYNQAIAIDPSKASFYSNKSAALMSLGNLIEAVFECQEAIRLDPSYHNAHYRLARLFIRLGEAGKAIDHFEKSGRKASSKDISNAENLETHLNRCSGARRRKDWETLLNHSQAAILMGADSAPQIYAMQAEALMELCRDDEAYKVNDEGPDFDIELHTRFLGSAETAKLLVVRSKIFMAAGRFEDAVAAARHAARLDSSDDVKSLVKKVDFVASTRIKGNRLFNASRYAEASLAYTSALEEVPYNSVLLCNRAACRSKLGQYEKAVEDCTEALKVRPSYSKARLRRADSNAKLERWEAALEDYETLMHVVPGDEEVTKGFQEARKQVKKQHNYEVEKPRTSSDLKSVISNKPVGKILTAAEFYGSSTSFKLSNGIDFDTSSGANCAAATSTTEFGRSVTTLREIFTH
ncbi:inactive TPR repeat-containing thioredoxin TTL3-like [Coffea eugenioides]|uniref:inactive TPR repeat-containing thioredoxin TTL3-like n=1 Tax=Coffea eugenioides TaxID=49369 RepID=UPI000F60D498|nr:inactive TPR repeat-containing thioredoxin TTL3-like [Coffea eugenioides]XP_027149359.1 inactive TPR repeat-containing thioredoxin TTL3-like [Coffea eugenioides]XP_027149360.1 inactive TPR repeat-containing thioredoxin TTL3-like [Coffea eugenioides]